MARNTQPVTIVVAVQTMFAEVDGNEVSVLAGQRVRSDAPIVRAHPLNFAPDGATSADIAAAKVAYGS